MEMELEDGNIFILEKCGCGKDPEVDKIDSNTHPFSFHCQRNGKVKIIAQGDTIKSACLAWNFAVQQRLSGKRVMSHSSDRAGDLIGFLISDIE